MNSVFLKRPMAAAAILAIIIVDFMFRFRGFSLLAAVSLIVVSAVLIIYRRRALVSIIAFAVSVSLLFTMQKIDGLHTLCGETIGADLTVIEDSRHYGDTAYVTVISDGGMIPKNTKFSLTYFAQDKLMSGDKIRTRLVLNSFSDSEYRDYCYGNSMFVEGKAESLEKVGGQNRFFYLVGALRKYITRTVFSNFDRDTAGFIIALTIGDKSHLSPTFEAAARRVGISHALVVSGLHLTIIMSFIFKLLDKFIYNRFLYGLLGIMCVIAVTAVCGFTLSIIRAAYMFAVASLAPIFKRNNDSINSLGTAIMIMLVSSPLAYLSASFRLSALATLAIVWVAPFYGALINNALRIKYKFLCELVNSVVTTISATIFTAPVCIKLFGAISVVSPITNLMILYPITWALTANITALIASVARCFIFIEKPFFLVAGMCAKYIGSVVKFVDSFPVTEVKAGNLMLWLSYAVVFVVIAYMYWYKCRLKRRNNDADNKRGSVKKRDILKKFGAGVSAFW